MLPIQFKPIRYNFNPGGNTVKYIVIHDTGNPTASALNHYNYFNGGNRGASAHYFVDDSNIIQLIKDSDRAWHCGDGRGRYGITNSNSIGIEICLPGNREKTVQHTLDLTAHLMKKYNVPLERVVRHFDCSGKSCPNFMRPNNWAKWIEFKTLLAVRLKGGNGMNENQVREIAKNEATKVKGDILKEVKSLIKPSIKNGESNKGHWSEEVHSELKSMGIEIHDERPNDLITRAEVEALLLRGLKAIQK